MSERTIAAIKAREQAKAPKPEPVKTPKRRATKRTEPLSHIEFHPGDDESWA